MTAPKKILFIDDDAFFVSIVSNAFTKKGFEVRTASGGGSGVDTAKKEHPALIFLDLTLSGMDGHATLAALKADPAVSKIPVIVLSSLSDDENIARAKQGGAADYLVKVQFTPGQLLERVKPYLAG